MTATKSGQDARGQERCAAPSPALGRPRGRMVAPPQIWWPVTFFTRHHQQGKPTSTNPIDANLVKAMLA